MKCGCSQMKCLWPIESRRTRALKRVALSPSTQAPDVPMRSCGSSARGRPNRSFRSNINTGMPRVGRDMRNPSVHLYTASNVFRQGVASPLSRWLGRQVENNETEVSEAVFYRRGTASSAQRKWRATYPSQMSLSEPTRREEQRHTSTSV